MRNSNQSTRSGLSAALMLLALTVMPEVGAQAASYQSAEPKLDSFAAPAEPKKIHGPLQGGVQHVDKRQQRSGKLIYGIKRGQQDTLRARVKDENSALKAQAESSIGIVGVKFVATLGHPPVINEVFPNTPAQQVGLRLQDMIVAVDGVPTSGLTKDEVFDLIVGTPGTQVSLSILRNGDYQVVTCTRMDINELNDPRVRRDYMIHM